jgi:poly(A) polymerase
MAPHPKKIPQIANERRFRAAYDFLVLRAKAGEPLQRIVDWWTQYQESDEEGQAKMRAKFHSKLASRKKRKT